MFHNPSQSNYKMKKEEAKSASSRLSRQGKRRCRQSNLKRWKTYNEKEVLEAFFLLDQRWTRKTINYVKDLVNLSEEQIYKWGYEKKRKMKTGSEESASSKSLPSVARIEQESQDKSKDYNSLVDELFPNSANLDDTLSPDEKVKYDELRDKIVSKASNFANMSEFDKLLYERLPSGQNLKLTVKASNKRRKCSAGELTTANDEIQVSEEFKVSSTLPTPKSENKRDLKSEAKVQEPDELAITPKSFCLFDEIDFENLSDKNAKSFEEECQRLPDFGTDMLDDPFGIFGQ